MLKRSWKTRYILLMVQYRSNLARVSVKASFVISFCAEFDISSRNLVNIKLHNFG